MPQAAAALSLGAFLCAAADQASTDALLSNLDEGDGTSIAVGASTDAPSFNATQAIRFETGSNERGYNLTSVKAVLAGATASDGVRVRIFGARSNGNPYYSLYTLTNPTLSDGTLTFTPPVSATVRKDTRYFVLFDSTGSSPGNDYEIAGTESDSLNSAATGWSLNTDRHAGNGVSLSWTTHAAIPLIEIHGDAVVQATDATLSALSIDDGYDKFVTNLSPQFDPAMTSYTSSAAAQIDQVTMQATAGNADGASVDYLDGNDQLRTDADTDAEGFQVDLEVGANTIEVRVTAEDGSTTRTYTIVVTRDAPLASPDALLSNLDEPNTESLIVGNFDTAVRSAANAVGFETGANEDGYVLTSVKAVISTVSHSAGVRARIFNNTAEGKPGSSLYTLSSTANDIGVRTFEAPADATLERDTRYFVVLDSTATKVGRYYKVRGTKSGSVNSAAAGWSLDTELYARTQSSPGWTTINEVLLVEINGHAVVPSSDATLSGLGLTRDDGGTETAIELNPAFGATTTDYAASVASGVARITIAGTMSDDDATVLYFDGTDAALSDADANATGFQVDLDLGV
ncbi:MAG: cadherin-like beta sandwich domain-containing protein, partial [Gammaproteobacteria bacterium]|nr:cadherin-like beta sandwich domain-containing protein [Gammaproteobacteria bacterium]